MHPLIRHLASRSPHRAGIVCLAVFLALIVGAGCNNKIPPKKPTSRYTNFGLKPVPSYLKDSIYERTDVSNTGPMAVSSYGLVVNLRHSGDSRAPPPVRDYIVKEMYRHGIDAPTTPGYEHITPEAILSDPRTAIVMVGAYIPAGARKGQRVDAYVQAIPGGNTASLAGGQLWRCDLRLRGVDPLNPGGSVIKYIQADGPIFINPALALETPGPGEAAARSGARLGTVIGGGRVAIDRPIHLRSRTPYWPVARSIEYVINTRFGDKTVAAAQDEGIIHLNVPLQYKGNWEHFVGVVNHLYITLNPAASVQKAQELAQEAAKPGALLENISYAFEGLGPVALPYLTPLLAHGSPDVQYAAARAGAFIGDRASEDTLMKIVTTSGHPFRINAIMALGELPNNSVINHALARCLDADEAQVRIEAYRILAENNDPHIYSYTVNNTYIVDEVRSNGKPLIYATRTGKPRLAIFGNRPTCNLPMTFSAFDHQLTISSDPNRRNVLSIFYRGPELQQPVNTASGPTIVELAARLGGAGTEGGRGLRFGYGEVVAMLQSLADSGKVSAAFVMQDLPNSGEDFDDSGTRQVAGGPPTGVGRPVGEPGPANAANVNAAPAKPGVGAPQGRPN
jgi:Flagellar P-ring protein/HEAT repeats